GNRGKTRIKFRKRQNLRKASHLFGFRTRAELRACPAFLRRLSLGDEENFVCWCGRGIQQQYGVRFVEPCQIVEVVLLLIFDKLLFGSGLQNENVSRDEAGEALPPRPVFLKRLLFDCKKGNYCKQENEEIVLHRNL